MHPALSGITHGCVVKAISDAPVALLLGCCAIAIPAVPAQLAAQTTEGAKATIYVYENGRQFAGDPLIYVNHRFLDVLNHKSYILREVPAGTLEIGMIALAQGQAERSSLYVSIDKYLPPTLRWPNCVGDTRKPSCTWGDPAAGQAADDHGCGKVDWMHVDGTPPEDLALCKRELGVTSAALENWLDPDRKTKEFVLGMLLPISMGAGLLGDSISGPKGDLSAWLQTCGLDPFPQRSAEAVEKIRNDLKRGDSSDDWSRCKDAVAAAYLNLQVKEGVRIDAEPGKAYFVKWSYSVSGGKMEMMDERTGTAEVAKLHPAKDR
jgi:hypothetical protein